MAQVPRKYTNISFDDIRDHLMSIVRAKEGPLADLGDSSYGKTNIELFAGLGDLMSNWIESAFENIWLETAYARPPVHAGSRSIGYSLRRPVPAKCSIGIRVTEIQEHGTLKVFIPKGTEFTMTGTTLTSMNDMEFVYDYDSDTTQSGLMTLVSGYNILAEGQKKTEILVSNGRQNQTFFLSDPSFSDYFGEGDPNFSDDGNVAHRPACFTTIASDATLLDNIDPDVVIDDKLYWRISRRGLEDPGLVDGGTDISHFSDSQGNYSTNYTVLVDTANDGNVALHFGDGLKAAIPFGNIEVTYFSTSGEAGNRLKVFGTALSTSGSGITITTKDGQETDIRLTDLNICLTSDIRGGVNIESIESIKNNAPGIFNTLDRLVTREAYKIFLRRYADVKYASAYGEDVLNTKLLNGGINVKYMNQVRFTALKDLYREKDGKYYPTSEDEYFLDGYKVNGLMYNWLYDFQDVGVPSEIDGTPTLKAISDGFSSKLASLVADAALVTKGDVAATDESLNVLKAGLMKLLGGYIPSVKFDDTVFSAFMTPMDFVVEGTELYNIMLALNRRGMLTVGDGFHNYVYPSVHNMEIKMDVVLFKGNNFTDIRERIKKVVYKYLKENTEFGTPIFRSKIAALVHTMKEVAGVDVSFQAADNGFQNLDLADYVWMGEATGAFVKGGTTAMNGMTYYIGSSVHTSGDEFAMRDQSDIQTKIAEYYRINVAPYIGEDGSGITDRLIDRFVAFIWDRVMQEIYFPIVEKMNAADEAGDIDTMTFYRGLLNAIKTWDMQKDGIVFKDTDEIKDIAEINGSTLYDYMRYGMDYIKLVRRVLGAKATASLINKDTGNVTEYSNDNEIVQFTIPNELINLSVAQESSLLTGTSA